MAENSNIEWTDHTFNPVIGCTKISTGCDNCYAASLVKRYGGDFGTLRRTTPENWCKPRLWNRQAEKAGRRFRVFCASLSDVFDNRWEPDWRADLWSLIRETPNLDWQLLTKRPQNIARMLPDSWGNGWPNVWLGTTVEDQERADKRIPALLGIPAPTRFLSCEPLLGPVDLSAIRFDVPDLGGDVYVDVLTGAAHSGDRRCPGPKVDWVICGGESGHYARPMHPVWAQRLHADCAKAAVPFFFKQWGKWMPAQELPANERPKQSAFIMNLKGLLLEPTGPCEKLKEDNGYFARMVKVTSKKAGRTFEGRELAEYPA